MQSIREIFNSRGYKFKSFNGTFGLEIETETESSDNYPKGFFEQIGSEKDLAVYEILPNGTGSKYWKAIEDHSLRNFGMEYVLKAPLSLSSLLDALEEFKRITDGIPFIKDPPGASVHAHVNMLTETPMTLANFITLWVMFETVLVEFCGVPRRSNLFALPVRVAEDGVNQYVKLFKGLYKKEGTILSNFIEDHCKYQALNIATLSRLGTVEARTMRGTTEVSVISSWVNILQGILDFARTPGLTPYDILQEVREDPSDLLFKVFRKFSDDLVKNNGSWKTQVERNLHYVYTLVDSIPSWVSFGEYPLVEKKEKTLKKKSHVNPYEQFINGDLSLNEVHAMTQPQIQSQFVEFTSIPLATISSGLSQAAAPTPILDSPAFPTHHYPGSPDNMGFSNGMWELIKSKNSWPWDVSDDIVNHTNPQQYEEWLDACGQTPEPEELELDELEGGF